MNSEETANEPTPDIERFDLEPAPADINLSFTEMADAYAAPEPEPDIFTSDHTGTEGAARELTDSRLMGWTPPCSRPAQPRGCSGAAASGASHGMQDNQP